MHTFISYFTCFVFIQTWNRKTLWYHFKEFPDWKSSECNLTYCAKGISAVTVCTLLLSWLLPFQACLNICVKQLPKLFTWQMISLHKSQFADSCVCTQCQHYAQPGQCMLFLPRGRIESFRLFYYIL